jgi:hypothetical protein
VFTPPHTYFFTREVDTNLGYVWYRKDAAGRFAFGIRQAEREEAQQYVDNFALFNAPPGTEQRMGVYFYASVESGEPPGSPCSRSRTATRSSRAGYKTMVNHFHLRFTERVRATKSFDSPIQDIAAMKALGLNIVGLSDFHGDLHANDAGAVRFRISRTTVKRRARLRRGFPGDALGGAQRVLRRTLQHPVSEERLLDEGPERGAAVHGAGFGVRTRLSHRQHGGRPEDDGRGRGLLVPRASADQGDDGVSRPDLRQGVDEERSVSRRRIQAGHGHGPVGGAHVRVAMLRRHRHDEQLYAGSGLRPKYVIADIDTYQKGPEDDLYPNFPVNYLRLDKVPGPDDDWSPVLTALRNGDFFVTTGEILIPSYKVEGTAANAPSSPTSNGRSRCRSSRLCGATEEDDRQIVSATDLGAFGTKQFRIPFDAAGKAWVRFAVWDSAGNGAFVQPVWIR